MCALLEPVFHTPIFENYEVYGYLSKMIKHYGSFQLCNVLAVSVY